MRSFTAGWHTEQLSLVSVACCLLSARLGPAGCPQQMNGCDCGAFLCMFALHAMNDQGLRFSHVAATYDMQPTSVQHATCDTRLNMRRTALHRAVCNDPHGMRRAKRTAQQRAQHAIQYAGAKHRLVVQSPTEYEAELWAAQALQLAAVLQEDMAAFRRHIAHRILDANSPSAAAPAALRSQAHRVADLVWRRLGQALVTRMRPGQPQSWLHDSS